VVELRRLVVQLALLGFELALQVHNTKEVMQILPVDGALAVAAEDTMVVVQEVATAEIMAQEVAAQASPLILSAATHRRLCRSAPHLVLQLLPQVHTPLAVKQRRMDLLSLRHTPQQPRQLFSITRDRTKPSARVAPLPSECSCGGLEGVLEQVWLVELVGTLTPP